MTNNPILQRLAVDDSCYETSRLAKASKMMWLTKELYSHLLFGSGLWAEK
jgi:hypothetical protein